MAEPPPPKRVKLTEPHHEGKPVFDLKNPPPEIQPLNNPSLLDFTMGAADYEPQEVEKLAKRHTNIPKQDRQKFVETVTRTQVSTYTWDELYGLEHRAFPHPKASENEKMSYDSYRRKINKWFAEFASPYTATLHPAGKSMAKTGIHIKRKQKE